MDAIENLDVWKRSCRLSVEVYRPLRDCRELGFKDQDHSSKLCRSRPISRKDTNGIHLKSSRVFLDRQGLVR